MRRDLFAVVSGFLIGAAALVGGGEEVDAGLEEKLARLQSAIARYRQDQQTPRADRLPPIGRRGHELELLPVYDLTSGRPDYLLPARWMEGDDESPLFGGVSKEAVLPVGTIEEIMEMVRASVMPRAWEEGSAIVVSGQTLLVVNSRPVLDAVSRFLEAEVRDKVHRCVTVEAQAVDLAPALYRALTEGGGTALTLEQERLLDGALAAGSARRAFRGRTTGFLGQQVYLWHGRQVALLAEPGASMAERMAAPDPDVAVLLAGGTLAFRASAADDPERITLEVEVALDELEGLDTVETKAGELDLAKVRTTRAKTSVTVPHRRWALLGGGTRVGGRVRGLFARVTYLPRNGGGR